MNGTPHDSVTDNAASPTDSQPMFDALREAFRSGRTRDLAWRRQQLEALERMMAERETDIIEALQQDLGSPRWNSWTAEISYVAGDAAYCRKNLKRWTRPRKVYTPARSPSRARAGCSPSRWAPC